VTSSWLLHTPPEHPALGRALVALAAQSHETHLLLPAAQSLKSGSVAIPQQVLQREARRGDLVVACRWRRLCPEVQHCLHSAQGSRRQTGLGLRLYVRFPLQTSPLRRHWPASMTVLRLLPPLKAGREKQWSAHRRWHGGAPGGQRQRSAAEGLSLIVAGFLENWEAASAS